MCINDAYYSTIVVIKLIILIVMHIYNKFN
jgi:hypothetical protein